MQLADRSEPLYPQGSPRVHSLVPLPELLGELLDVGPASKKVSLAYGGLIRRFGSEFNLLLDADPKQIEGRASPLLAEAVRRMREGQVIRTPGFDGQFGRVHVFSDQERKSFGGQQSLFPENESPMPVGKQRTAGSALSPARQVKRKKRIRIRLNPEQQQVVDSKARHIIVTAGPGTGKTHTLIRRVLRIAQEGQPPCTLITFTNRAADELRSRLFAALPNGSRVFAGTLHGYCLRWLRRENSELQVAGPDMRRLLLAAVFPGEDRGEIESLDSRITSFLQTGPDPARAVPQKLQEYFSALGERGLIDLDAVIPAVSSLLKSNPSAAARIREETGALFIDEFQDLNESQYLLVRQLAESSPVFAIGDPDQAIYAFRGSSPAWFFRFISELEPEQHVLFRNYRSRQVLVDGAAEVIAGNRHRSGAAVNRSVSPDRGFMGLYKASSPAAEADFVVQRIERLLGGTSHREIDKLREHGNALTLGDIAVLYRTGLQAKCIAAALARQGLPFQVVDIKPFYEKAPARLLYLWALLLAGMADSGHILSLLGLEKGLGKIGLKRIESVLALRAGDPLAVLSGQISEFSRDLRRKIDGFRSLVSRVRQETAEKGILSGLRMVMTVYGLAADDPDIKGFFQLAENFSRSANALAAHLQRYGDSVIYDTRADAVMLMTMHAAKGLEFKAVFLVGLEEDLLPIAPRGLLAADRQLEHIEEERRLFYVAMTRAGEMLHLSYAEQRTIDGRSVRRLPSRFLAEIPAGSTSRLETEGWKKGRQARAGKQLTLF